MQENRVSIVCLFKVGLPYELPPAGRKEGKKIKLTSTLV